MAFDLPSFVNLVVSAAISVVLSWLIAHWYYRKSGPVERMLKEIKSVLPSYFHPVIYPQFYSSDIMTVSPDQPFPNDPDTPHIECVTFSKKVIVDGDRVDVLLKVRDTGRNLENPSGISVRDHLERELAVKSIGLGFAAITLRAKLDAKDPLTKLTVTLTDTAGKRNTQSIPFLVHSR